MDGRVEIGCGLWGAFWLMDSLSDGNLNAAGTDEAVAASPAIEEIIAEKTERTGGPGLAIEVIVDRRQQRSGVSKNEGLRMGISCIDKSAIAGKRIVTPASVPSICVSWALFASSSGRVLPCRSRKPCTDAS